MSGNIETLGLESDSGAVSRCPKCGRQAFPEGSLVSTPVFKFKTLVKVFCFKLPVSLNFRVEYDPGCGYLAVKGGE